MFGVDLALTCLVYYLWLCLWKADEKIQKLPKTWRACVVSFLVCLIIFREVRNFDVLCIRSFK